MMMSMLRSVILRLAVLLLDVVKEQLCTVTQATKFDVISNCGTASSLSSLVPGKLRRDICVSDGKRSVANALRPR